MRLAREGARTVSAVRAGAHYFVALGALVLLTAFLHRDVLAAPSRFLLGGDMVGPVYLWLSWWWDHAFRTGSPLFFTRMLMYPDGLPVLTVSPLCEAAGVLLSRGGTLVAGTNAVMMGLFVLNGAAAYFLIYDMTRHPAASFFGAFVFAFSDYTITQHAFGQVGAASLFAGPLFAAVVLRFRERASAGRAIGVVLGWGLLGLTGPYATYTMGVLFLLGLTVFEGARGREFFRGRPVGAPWIVLLGGLLLVSLAEGCLYAPLVAHYGRWKGGDTRLSMILASVIDMPSWHPSAWVQFLRPLGGVPHSAEENTAFLGWEVLAILGMGAAGIRFRRDARFRLWGFLFLWAGVLSLGAHLKIRSSAPSPFPLPGAFLESLPLASQFRAVSRTWALALLASSVLASLVLAELLKNRSRWWGAAVVGGLLVFRFWEFDLGALGGWKAPAAVPSVYETLRADPGDFALLELPQALSPTNPETPVIGYTYMRYQTRHGHPLVLGSPPRYTEASLRFTEETPLVYELTHPGVISALRESPWLASRLKSLRRDGQGIFTRWKIKYAIFHPGLPGFSAAAARDTRWLLEYVFGQPARVDEDGNRLYRIYDENF